MQMQCSDSLRADDGAAIDADNAAFVVVQRGGTGRR